MTPSKEHLWQGGPELNYFTITLFLVFVESGFLTLKGDRCAFLVENPKGFDFWIAMPNALAIFLTHNRTYAFMMVFIIYAVGFTVSTALLMRWYERSIALPQQMKMMVEAEQVHQKLKTNLDRIAKEKMGDI